MWPVRFGLKHSGVESSASFSDFDNDGFLDLFIVKEDGNILYENKEKGVFVDVSNKAELPQDPNSCNSRL